MSARFVNLDRPTPVLLPCALRDWVSADHVMHFILDAVEELPLSMLLALLIYSYATGRFGSPTIEAATVAQGKRDQRKYRGLRDSADTALDGKLATGRKVLAAVLPEDDARWLDFRPDVPGDLDRPDQVEGVQAQPGAPGRLRVTWEPGARAERYVVQVLVEGQDTAFRNVTTVQDPGADVEVGPGARVQVRVIARNASGPTVPSETLHATAPLAAAA